MKTIHKFKLLPEDKQAIALPRDAKILCVQSQKEQPCLWVLMDDNDPITVGRMFRTIGTGECILEDVDKLQYIDTFQSLSGNLVSHVFEIMP